MKGLELSERYYSEVGKDTFSKRFGALMDRVAVGLAGPGSECFGFDDEFSRDHDWGPGFCLWVTRDDFQRYGRELQECYDALPKDFLGFGPRRESAGETGRVGVMVIEAFFKRYTGLDHPPQNLDEWDIPSANLALCVNGRVFSDPLGTFSQWRRDLEGFYPRDIWLKKIADACMRAGQSGQYNWQRGIQRNDPFVIQTAKTAFCKEIFKLVFLLNKAYAPYYKWLAAGARQLPFMGGDIYSLVCRLLGVNDAGTSGGQAWQAAGELLDTICQKMIQALSDKGVSDGNRPFLIDHVPSILSRIGDEEFRGRQWQGASDGNSQARGDAKSGPAPSGGDGQELSKRELISNILKREWAMFSTVNDRADLDPARKNCPTCRDFPEEFRLHRTAQLMVWSPKTLSLYLKDLEDAQVRQKNLMTYKYARMENLIPKENNSRYIDLIADVLVEWQNAFISKYPGIMSGGRPLTREEDRADIVSFETYLRGELETYSERTLASLYDDILDCRNHGETFPERIYGYLVREKGYDSLNRAEGARRLA
ncbi:MAG: DUF4125 family protein [Desulfobacter sp.]|nr:MAG: DUF4125 family protein [Desulfobacter sp.]